MLIIMGTTENDDEEWSLRRPKHKNQQAPAVMHEGELQKLKEEVDVTV